MEFKNETDPHEAFHGGQLQGQFSQPHQIRQPPPLSYQPPSHMTNQHDGRIMVPKGKEHELLIATPSDAGGQGHQQNSAEQHFKHQQRPLFNPPHGPPPFRGDQGHPKPPHLAAVQSGQEALTANILKEFLSKAQGIGKPPPRYPGPPPPHHGGGNIWGPPGKQNVLHGGPQHGGKPFQASKEVANDLQAEGGEFPGPVVQYGGVLGPNPAGPWPQGPEAPDMAKIVTLDVKCEKNVMRIFVAFDRPFYGVIFSKVRENAIAIALMTPNMVSAFDLLLFFRVTTIMCTVFTYLPDWDIPPPTLISESTPVVLKAVRENLLHMERLALALDLILKISLLFSTTLKFKKYGIRPAN